MDLLLLTDPAGEIVEEYIKRGEYFIAESDNQTIGVNVLLSFSLDQLRLSCEFSSGRRTRG